MNPQVTPLVEDAATTNVPAKSHWRRFFRGLVCALSFLVLPIGPFAAGDGSGGWNLNGSIEGVVLILPGIEGRSLLNISLMAGLLDGGLPYATEIIDWTTGHVLLAIYHLRAWSGIAAPRFLRSPTAWSSTGGIPGPPCVAYRALGGRGDGASDGGAPAGRRGTDGDRAACAGDLAALLPASPHLPRTARGIWNFYSACDVGFARPGFTDLLGRLMAYTGWPPDALALRIARPPSPAGRAPIAADPLSPGNDPAVQSRGPLRLRAPGLCGGNHRADHHG